MRRTPGPTLVSFRRRADAIIAATIAVIVAAVLVVVWLRSDARGTTSTTASPPAATMPGTLPAQQLQQRWAAPDAASQGTVLTTGSAVVTADGGTVTGRDVTNGAERWRYARQYPLCGAAVDFSLVVAVYRDARGCSQVTSLRPDTGARQGARTSDADEAITLHPSTSYLLAQGDSRLESWRSDLVRTLEYGRVDAPVLAHAQPRSDCRLLDAAASSARFAVLERCAGDPASATRLSLLDPAPSDAMKPTESASTLLEVADARLVGMLGDRAAVYLPGNAGGTIGIFDAAGTQITTVPVDAGATAEARPAVVGGVLTWWSGHDLYGFDVETASPTWVYPGTLGPAGFISGELVVPVPGGAVVLDPRTGRPTRTLAFDRGTAAPTGAIVDAALGDTVLEQRDGVLYAYA